MTDTDVNVVNVEEALALIDQGLGLVHGRELMSSSEVADMLLDVRVLLAASAAEDTPEPAGAVN